MRTSRIAKDTSKVAGISSPTTRTTRWQTRSITRTLRSYRANGPSATDTEGEKVEIKEELVISGDSSELSSAGSALDTDIEDAGGTFSASKRRRLDLGSSSTISIDGKGSNVRKVKQGATISADYELVKPPKKARKQPAKKVSKADGQVEIHPPPRWEETYALVREMRSQVAAPVDTMGCERLAEKDINPRVRIRAPRPSSTDADPHSARPSRTNDSKP